ncbi:hypothetical protein TRFO_23961 [Tritrichomonas foetus]|uniref:Uncharacterized protein n=1 Tax=Tritrichomonas foetus TaxID=1144522 RepID=A0A1J4KDR1_9EUKA|nr:hypothetical protein TRFO_23961 [Tritrichomonas foetus]|eukprot:OHT07766.1 hypothetical protein TRFO_23961 [Tritrichomonas foetus]
MNNNNQMNNNNNQMNNNNNQMNNNMNANANHNIDLINDNHFEINNAISDQFLFSLLHIAATYHSSFEIIQFLIDFCSISKNICHYLNQNDSKNVSFFTKAIETSNVDLLMILLNNFVEQKVDSTQLMPIHIASQNNNSEFIQLLAEYGADVNCMTMKKSETPLHIACKRGNYQAALSLLDLDADPTIVDSRLRTPMHYAAKLGRVDIVEILYDFGADPQAYDCEMMTPMNFAFLRENVECMNFFKELGLECDNFELLEKNRKKKGSITGNKKSVFGKKRGKIHRKSSPEIII